MEIAFLHPNSRTSQRLCLQASSWVRATGLARPTFMSTTGWVKEGNGGVSGKRSDLKTGDRLFWWSCSDYWGGLWGGSLRLWNEVDSGGGMSCDYRLIWSFNFLSYVHFSWIKQFWKVDLSNAPSLIYKTLLPRNFFLNLKKSSSARNPSQFGSEGRQDPELPSRMSFSYLILFMIQANCHPNIQTIHPCPSNKWGRCQT